MKVMCRTWLTAAKTRSALVDHCIDACDLGGADANFSQMLWKGL